MHKSIKLGFGLLTATFEVKMQYKLCKRDLRLA